MNNRLSNLEIPLTEEERTEALALWKGAIDYFNSITEALMYFPAHADSQVTMRLRAFALSICEQLARAAHPGEGQDIHQGFIHAMEYIKETLAYLMIASKWRYIREEQYEDFYAKGRLLAKRIERFKLTVP